MVIRTLEDMMELLSNRVEAMEDLNCEDLEECVRAFMLTFGSIHALNDLKVLARTEPKNSKLAIRAKHEFDEGIRLVTKMLERIDELTLRGDAAE